MKGLYISLHRELAIYQWIKSELYGRICYPSVEEKGRLHRTCYVSMNKKKAVWEKPLSIGGRKSHPHEELRYVSDGWKNPPYRETCYLQKE